VGAHQGQQDRHEKKRTGKAKEGKSSEANGQTEPQPKVLNDLRSKLGEVTIDMGTNLELGDGHGTRLALLDIDGLLRDLDLFLLRLGPRHHLSLHVDIIKQEVTRP